MGSKGFSLIEILLAVSILVGVSSMGFFGFSRINEGRDAGDAYETLLNNLNEAKSSAIAQILPSPATNCSNLDVAGYRVSLFSTYYYLEVICSRASGSQTFDSIRKVTLPTGMILTSNIALTGNVPRIFFTTDGSSTTSGNICLTKSGKTKSIDINENGVISGGDDC